jgi:hypothetical protein
MRKIAEKYIEKQQAPVRLLTPALLTTVLFGIGSIVLYVMLYKFNYDIRHLAEMTNQGDKSFFLIPIGIAFIFSFIHGSFTGHFWDAMGLKAKA